MRQMLTVLEVLPGRKCRCACECGRMDVIKFRYNVMNGHTKSCGCASGGRGATHEENHCGNRSPEYTIWMGMKQRCYDQKCKSYPYYGGRGITVCEQWVSNYPAFLAAVGRRPSPGHQLDRWPNNNGNYEPGNVRWATREEQCRNRRTSHKITAFGRTATIAEWSDVMGRPAKLISQRVNAGWSAERALMADSRMHGGRRLAEAAEYSEGAR